ncbi:MAG: hypothetical protein KDJ19_01745 [Hyphomicrobiaceae bacterium]|nr:hypothetical protein [Hyphomicrobiaceae bacterium]MCC0024254.1 hypothetical protein [Hyphomicrobiaceae bacterium]
MNWNNLMRVIHRWISALFIICVLMATYAAATGQDTTSMLYYLPLPPLFVLMASGIYMFALHYVRKWRGRSAV